MIGLIELIGIVITSAAGYYGYQQLVADKLDSPRNNEVVKGLDKSELKAKVKDTEAEIKKAKTEIKDLDTERKALLKDDTKKEEAQEKLEAKEEKAEELKKLEADLKDLKAVEKGSYQSYLPNKLTLNNGLWLGGSLLGLVVLYKATVSVLGSVFPTWRNQ